MTSFTQEKIFEKIENLNEYLGYLKALRKEAKSEKLFIIDFHLFGNTERYLHLSIQVIIDIAHLVIIDLGLRKPENNYEAISILFEKKIISTKMSDKLTKMIGLRNILVHEYGKIDRKQVYQVLQTQLSDIEGFKKRILVFLKKD